MASQQSHSETYRLAFPGTEYPYISHGLPFPEACAKHVNDTFKASRVYIIASGSLSKNTDHVKQLQEALGGKIVGIRGGMTPHTRWSEVLEIAEECRKTQADLIVTLGAGSLTDGAKIVSLVSSNARSKSRNLKMLTNTRLSRTMHQPSTPSPR